MPGATQGKKANEPRRSSEKRIGNMVRVSDQTHRILRDLSEETGESMQDLLTDAVESMRRRRILEETNAAYAALRADPERWQAEIDERNEWETALADGMESE